MLTKIQTVETDLSPTEKIALDDQKVCEAFMAARVEGNKKVALEYAKVIMLKAFAVGRPSWDL
jgi:hypothetical protein